MTVRELIAKLSDDELEAQGLLDFEVYLEVPEIDTYVPIDIEVDEEEKCVFLLFED